MGGRLALVLGGGGVAGIAWEFGLLAGLADGGVDLTAADLIVGTSAGATVGAEVACGVPLADCVARQRVPTDQTLEQARPLDGPLLAEIFGLIVECAGRPDQQVLARIGALALAADTPGEDERLAIVAARLTQRRWPTRRFVTTAIDAASGEFVTFGAHCGATLVEAVAASSAVPGVWPPVTIGDRRYYDGGLRSAVNADLAAGWEQVVIVAPMAMGAALVDAEAETLRAGGSQVTVIGPDEASVAAMSPNPLDPATRGPSVEAGLAQGAAMAAAMGPEGFGQR